MNAKTLRLATKAAKEKLKHDTQESKQELDTAVEHKFNEIRMMIDNGDLIEYANKGEKKMVLDLVNRHYVRPGQSISKYKIYSQLVKRYSKYNGIKIRLVKFYLNGWSPCCSGYELVLKW